MLSCCVESIILIYLLLYNLRVLPGGMRRLALVFPETFLTIRECMQEFPLADYNFPLTPHNVENLL
jgi:hypothetical protein